MLVVNWLASASLVDQGKTGLVTLGSTNRLVASDILRLVSDVEEEGWRADLAAVGRARPCVGLW